MCYVQRRSSVKRPHRIKGRARHIPNRTDTVVRFGPEHVVLFLHLCDSVSKGCHKATTLNGVPQEKGSCDNVVCKLVLCLDCCSDVANSYKQYE